MKCDLCKHELSVPQKYLDDITSLQSKDETFHIYCSEQCWDLNELLLMDDEEDSST